MKHLALLPLSLFALLLGCVFWSAERLLGVDYVANSWAGKQAMRYVDWMLNLLEEKETKE